MAHHHPKKFYAFIFGAGVIALAVFTQAFVWLNTRPLTNPLFGVTFSWVYAQQLGNDPLSVLDALIQDLGIKEIRLPLYWSEIEREQGVFDWALADALVEHAEQSGVDLTLVVGMKVPRWPECYVPDWAETMDTEDQQQVVLLFIEEAVNRYKGSSAVLRWQVENEPFFPFGQCPTTSVEQFQERVELVQSLDDRPIQVTVSGELGPWLDSVQSADILGISMYRQTWNDVVGYFIYPIPPEYYFFRARLVDDYVEKTIVSELQAEPWFPDPIHSRPITQWYDAFTTEMFEQNVMFAREAGLSEVYLWGAEWWYALKQAGDDRLWEYARPLFQN